MVRFSKGQVIAVAIHNYVPDHLKSGPFKIWMFLSWFEMFFDKKVAICPDYKWSGFWIEDSIWNRDHLQPNLSLTI